jgi:hypothetical protein
LSLEVWERFSDWTICANQLFGDDRVEILVMHIGGVWERFSDWTI